MASQVTLEPKYITRIRDRLRSQPRTVLDERPRGYNPKVLVTNTSDGKYFCSDCHWILKQPLQSFCGHRYCTDCFKYITRSPSSEPVKCKLCVQEGTESEFSILKNEQTFPDNGIRREVGALEARCISRGCDWKGLFKDYQIHEPECPYKQIQCPQCGGDLKPDELQRHTAERCPATPVTCPYCALTMTRGKLNFHQCSQLAITCPGCDKKLVKDELLEHADPETGHCQRPHIVCVFGCNTIVQPKDLKEHLREDLESHICELHQRVLQFEEELKKYGAKDELPQVPTEGSAGMASAMPAGMASATPAEPPAAAASSTTAIERQQQQLQHQINKVEHELRTLVTRVEMSGNTVANATPSVAAAAAVGGIVSADSHRQVEILDKKILVFERVSAVFKKEIEKIGRQVEDLLKDNQENKDRVETMLRQFQTIERQFTTQKATVTDLSQRLTTSEVSSYDGTLVWRLNNFRQRRDDAKFGRATSFYSPAFYTSRTGYKACARIYLNGDGMGKNTHVSLFFVLMRSDYDALLPWPFQQKVTLMWMDQNKRENIVDTFRPDPTSSSFKRPTSDMNIASGCPLFMPLATLDSPTQGYVKDDIAFVKITIDKTNIDRM